MTEGGDRAIIELRGVRKSFGDLDVLKGIDLAVAPGSTTVVIGPSGCGKSVLLKHIVGILKPDGGRVFFDGRDVTDAEQREWIGVRRRIGMVFQGGALFDSLSVLENVRFPLDEHGALPRGERSTWASESLKMVGLDGVESKMPQDLSGGQRKRVALARAVVIDPDVILYDEPTTGLDPIGADLINELILRLQARLNTTAVVVTHDMTSARKIADRIVMLYRGRFIADTTAEALDEVDDDAVRRFVEGRVGEEELQRLDVGRLHEKDVGDVGEGGT